MEAGSHNTHWLGCRLVSLPLSFHPVVRKIMVFFILRSAISNRHQAKYRTIIGPQAFQLRQVWAFFNIAIPVTPRSVAATRCPEKQVSCSWLHTSGNTYLNVTGLVTYRTSPSSIEFCLLSTSMAWLDSIEAPNAKHNNPL